MISGSGAVQQLGAGTTTLTAANTYTGGTLVNAGMLQVGPAPRWPDRRAHGQWRVSTSGTNQTVGAIAGTDGAIGSAAAR